MTFNERFMVVWFYVALYNAVAFWTAWKLRRFEPTYFENPPWTMGHALEVLDMIFDSDVTGPEMPYAIRRGGLIARVMFIGCLPFVLVVALL